MNQGGNEEVREGEFVMRRDEGEEEDACKFYIFMTVVVFAILVGTGYGAAIWMNFLEENKPIDALNA